MSSKRIYGIDFGKGLAIAGMLLAHTFEAGICDWQHDVELKFLNMVPFAVKVVGAPIMLVCMMGLFFTYLTSMTCTMSCLRAEKKGDGAVLSYLLYRFAFAVVLKAVELVMSNWWENFGIFDTMTISFPTTDLDRTGGTLDSVGICGFLVPLLVYLVRKLPKVKENCFYQVACLTTIGLLLLLGYNYIADAALAASAWCYNYKFNLVGTFLSKVGSGSFMLAQCIPFGIIGGALSLIYVNKRDWKYMWRYCGVILSVTLVVTAYFFLCTPNPFEEVMSERKPCFVRFLEVSVETLACVFVSYYTDNEKRPLVQRYHLNKNLTFFRRISCASLSAFVYEKWVSKQLRKVFSIFVGQPYDEITREVYWNLWTVLIFMLVNYAIDLWVLSLWEKIHFNFSCEHLIANILSSIFGRKEEVNWKESNDKVIYGPNKELEAEILLNSKLSEKLRDKESDTPANPIRTEMELTSSFIEVQVDLAKE